MIDIIMATYNGEKYLDQQIKSIVEQTVEDWRLFIRDDASEDNTVEIIKKYAAAFPDKIFYSVREKNSGNPKMVFFELIAETKGEYIVSCDQDDIWNRDKLAILMRCFKKNDNKKPLLVHTDLTVIDEKNRITSRSMVKQQHIPVKAVALNRLLAQNVVTGCSMAFNRALCDELKEPDGLPVHDWWIAAVAAIKGRIIYINRSTVYYRKHSQNVCGAQNMNSLSYIFNRFKDSKRAEQMLGLGYCMAGELALRYSDELDRKQLDMLLEYAAMPSVCKLHRLYICMKYGIWKSGIVRKLGQIFYM